MVVARFATGLVISPGFSVQVARRIPGNPAGCMPPWFFDLYNWLIYNDFVHGHGLAQGLRQVLAYPCGALPQGA